MLYKGRGNLTKAKRSLTDSTGAIFSDPIDVFIALMRMILDSLTG